MRHVDKLLLNFPLLVLSAIFLQRRVVKAAAQQISCLRKEVTARSWATSVAKVLSHQRAQQLLWAPKQASVHVSRMMVPPQPRLGNYSYPSTDLPCYIWTSAGKMVKKKSECLLRSSPVLVIQAEVLVMHEGAALASVRGGEETLLGCFMFLLVELTKPDKTRRTWWSSAASWSLWATGCNTSIRKFLFWRASVVEFNLFPLLQWPSKLNQMLPKAKIGQILVHRGRCKISMLTWAVLGLRKNLWFLKEPILTVPKKSLIPALFRSRLSQVDPSIP